MKKLMIVLGLMLFCFQACFADEIESAQAANDNRAVITVQKQPAKENKQEVKNNWFCIILQINGKREPAEGESGVYPFNAGEAR